MREIRDRLCRKMWRMEGLVIVDLISRVCVNESCVNNATKSFVMSCTIIVIE